MPSKPNARGYVWEKMYAAVGSMCGRSPLDERLYNASVAGLMRLEDHDLDGDLGEDLKYVLDWTKRNVDGDSSVTKVPDDIELSRLIDKMLHILIETQGAP